MGLAPNFVEPGDHICVLIGCNVPLVLRPTGSNDHKVVGECYVHGMMDGAAFLGPLPSNWRRVFRYVSESRRFFAVFVNKVTGEIRAEDPRLGVLPLPRGWHMISYSLDHVCNMFTNDDAGAGYVWWDPRLEPQSLRERGVDLQDFRLV